MQGMYQYAVSEIRLEVTSGDCTGCDFAGVADAVLDPMNEVARWSCPACKADNETEIPTDDTRSEDL